MCALSIQIFLGEVRFPPPANYLVMDNGPANSTLKAIAC